MTYVINFYTFSCIFIKIYNWNLLEDMPRQRAPAYPAPATFFWPDPRRSPALAYFWGPPTSAQFLEPRSRQGEEGAHRGPTPGPGRPCNKPIFCQKGVSLKNFTVPVLQGGWFVWYRWKNDHINTLTLWLQAKFRIFVGVTQQEGGILDLLGSQL